MSALKPGCTARVRDGAWIGQLVEVTRIAKDHVYKNFSEEGAYVHGEMFGTWVPLDSLEWVSDEAPVWPPRYDDDEEEDGCEDCEDLRAEVARLTAERNRLKEALVAYHGREYDPDEHFFACAVYGHEWDRFAAEAEAAPWLRDCTCAYKQVWAALAPEAP